MNDSKNSLCNRVSYNENYRYRETITKNDIMNSIDEYSRIHNLTHEEKERLLHSALKRAE